LPQEKPSAQVLTADGAGGMRAVVDNRFEGGTWPIDFVVKAKDATPWMAHLHAESEARGWQSGGLSQIDAAQSSGSLSLHTAAGPSPTLEVAWEKARDKALRVRARPSADPALPIETAREFFAAVDTRLRLGTTIRAHRRVYLTYEVLPWRGELWLDADIRLGPPSKHPPALFGPQIVVVDATIEGIGSQGVNAQFQRTLTELRIFLSVLLGCPFAVDKWQEGWVCEADQNGRITDCRVVHLGYAEVAEHPGFPLAGSMPPVPRRTIQRPGIGEGGIGPDTTERWVPDEIEQLWATFRALPEDKRDHLLKAGNAHLLAQTMWPEQRTAYASFLVVACEALKPRGRSSHGMNVYDVVESLAGTGEGVKLRSLAVAPQRVRSDHFHRGELLDDELGALMLSDTFMDPSFDDMLRTLSMTTRVCLIEWLRCKGDYKVVRIPRDTSRRGWRRVASDALQWLQARIDG
jgi:hypothetical protein